MRRPQIILQDQDTEVVRAEKDSIEGHKNTLQAEVLVIAENKKKLEAQFKESKKQLEEEFIAKKNELDSGFILLQKRNQTAKNELEKSENDSMHAMNRTAQLIKEKNSLAEEVTLYITKKDSTKKEYLIAEGEKISLKREIALLTPQLEKINGQISESNLALKKILSDKESQLLEVSILEKKTSDLKNELKHIENSLVENSKKITISGREKIDAESKLSIIKNELEIAEKNLEQVRANAKSQSESIGEKMESLVRLQSYVDDRLQLFKEAKALFSTEQLVRMGIKD